MAEVSTPITQKVAKLFSNTPEVTAPIWQRVIKIPD